jgi:CheY-like chemotaxis protein
LTEPIGSQADEGAGSEGDVSRPVYSIGAVVKMLGVDASTLRAWEERYGLVVPDRSRGGQRIYSRDELTHLRFVIDSMADGVSPGDAHRMLAEKIQSPDRPAGTAASNSKLMILLAERDRYAADLVEYLLRTEGYEIFLAFDPAEALSSLTERRPQLAIVELMIAGGGLELCADLARSGDTPVLALSALDLAEEALAAGASAFVPKPINPLQLVSAVKDLLGQSALTRRAVEGAEP